MVKIIGCLYGDLFKQTYYSKISGEVATMPCKKKFGNSVRERHNSLIKANSLRGRRLLPQFYTQISICVAVGYQEKKGVFGG